MIPNFVEKLQDPSWLLGADNVVLQARLGAWQEALHAVQDPRLPRRLLIQERDPISFLAALWAGTELGYAVFLGDPAWGQRQIDQALKQIQGGYWIRNGAVTPLGGAGDPVEGEDEWILIPTGGSSGTVRFAIHTGQTLGASVEGFRAFLGVDAIHSVAVLPLHHVSGLMSVMRALFTGGTVQIRSWQEQARWEFCTLPDSLQPHPDLCLSLVPTQVQRLLKTGDPRLIHWLQSLRMILVGGGPTWGSLRQQARQLGIPVALTYGMTETASQIATLPPADFLAGQEDGLPLLPHAQVQLVPDPFGSPFPHSPTLGRIQIQSASLCLGYYPHPSPGPLLTEDWGEWDPQGRLQILGRGQDLINSGGEKIFAPAVEAECLALPGILDVCVGGIPDPEWGEKVVALVVLQDPGLSIQSIQAQLQTQLSPPHVPKQWRVVERIPRNAQGKVDRQAIMSSLFSSSFTPEPPSAPTNSKIPSPTPPTKTPRH